MGDEGQQQPEVAVQPAGSTQPVMPGQPVVASPLSGPAQLAALSGWRIGFAAGISFALTISLIAGFVWFVRNGSDWLAQSERQQMNAQEAADAPKVRPEFQVEVRALADFMERESALLDQPPAEVKKSEAELENRLSDLNNKAQTAHEHEIAFDLQDKHMGVSDCLGEIIFGGKPNTPPSSCKEQVPKKEEIEAAVNTPYRK
ncbi:hypothetical protein [Terriglobus sp.]|uniref:hypothetical protein n=1 Tax=Terriglobus sp. TaxID=1889013 RepID=UPI003B001C6B